MHSFDSFITRKSFFIDDIEYFYAETTAVGWQIGEIPDMDSSTAILYPIS